MDKDKIKNSFYYTLEHYNWDPNPAIVSKMVENSIDAKKKIIEVLRKHPNWIEDEMCIVLSDKKQERNFSKTAIFDFYYALLKCNGYNDLDADKKERIRVAFTELKKIGVQFLTPVERPIVDALNALNPEYRIHYTGKTSKIIMKVCKEEGLDKLEDFQKKFAELSDLINPREIQVKEVISVNPVDFLEMSNGEAFNWVSCHNLIDGCHKAGTISYLLDHDSLVYFQVLEETPIENIHNVSRYLRQVWMYKDECLAASRLYPQDNDGENSKNIYDRVRTSVLDVFAKCLGVEDEESPWLTSHKLANRVIEMGDDDSSAYPDWEYGNPGSHRCTVSKLRTRTKDVPIFYGGVTARCVKCGNYVFNPETLYCEECD